LSQSNTSATVIYIVKHFTQPHYQLKVALMSSSQDIPKSAVSLMSGTKGTQLGLYLCDQDQAGIPMLIKI